MLIDFRDYLEVARMTIPCAKKDCKGTVTIDEPDKGPISLSMSAPVLKEVTVTRTGKCNQCGTIITKQFTVRRPV